MPNNRYTSKDMVKAYWSGFIMGATLAAFILIVVRGTQ